MQVNDQRYHFIHDRKVRILGNIVSTNTSEKCIEITSCRVSKATKSHRLGSQAVVTGELNLPIKRPISPRDWE